MSRSTAIEKISQAVGSINGDKPLPVYKWHPPYCGQLDIKIDRNGEWHYMESPIRRKALVRLFARVLRKDSDGITYLVTPVEKVAITVDYAHFIAVDLLSSGKNKKQRIIITTNVGDSVAIDDHHRLRPASDIINGGLLIYVTIRGRLDALLSRDLSYQLTDLCCFSDDGLSFGLWSYGTFTPLAPADYVK